MGSGVNLDNSLSAPVEDNWALVLHEQYFIDGISFTVVGYVLKIETKTGSKYFKKVLINK